MNYECHITLKISDEDVNDKIEDTIKSNGWKHSYIVGDPVLGDHKTFQYATAHFKTREDAFVGISEMMDKLRLIKQIS